MNASSELADMLCFHRKKQGLAQLGLAELADVGKTVIFDIESGKETVQVDTLKKVLSALEIRIKIESPLMQEFARSRMELES